MFGGCRRQYVAVWERFLQEEDVSLVLELPWHDLSAYISGTLLSFCQGEDIVDASFGEVHLLEGGEHEYFAIL